MPDGGQKQHPRRPSGFFESVMMDWRILAMRRELTDLEHMTLAAQYLGLVIASIAVSPETQIEYLSVAAKITHTASLARTAVKQGAAWPVQTASRSEMGKRERMFR